jgi:hypothetical protein
MFPKIALTFTCFIAMLVGSPARSQDSPSLGDLARQAQKDKDKDKTNKPQAKVITNEDMPSSSGGMGPGLGRAGANQSPEASLQMIQQAVDHLDSLDRATLATDVLEGNSTDFPGRAQWEQKLFVAKQTFVAQTRGILQRARQLTAAAASIKDAENQNDPKVKSLAARLTQMVQETEQDGAAFQAVVVEGKQLAAHSAASSKLE